LFVPPIGERKILSEYVKKLIDESIIIIARERESNKIYGVAAYYCTPSIFEFAFLSYIASEGSIKGVGSALVENMIKDCKIKGMIGIETQTWESNRKSLHLFEKFGFQRKGFLKNRQGKFQSILLKLVF
jgi:L-amino acid N-acyltransferase YncA